MLQTHRRVWLISLICCLGAIVPAISSAAPDIAHASVTARVLVPISLAVSYDTAIPSRPAQLIISQPDNRLFQLHIDSNHYNSYESCHSGHKYPLRTAFKSPKSAKNQSNVTLYFN